MRINKKIDFVVVCVWILIGAGISLLFSLKPLIGGVISLLPPAVYLIFREKKNGKKIFWAVLIFGAIFGFIFDFAETANRAWVIERLVFPWRIFGFYPLLDDLIGLMLMTLLIVVFYEHFLDDEKNPRVSKNLIWALVPSALVLISILFVYNINPDFLKIPYAYLIGGLLAIVFPLLMGIYKPRILGKLAKIVAFFFGVWFIAELVTLKTGGWIFAGQYIGQVEIWGLRFPFEELFFWIMFYAATIVSYYEFFIDDKK